MTEKTVFVKEYTKTPGGRYRTDGTGNGQAFREDYIEKIWNDYEIISVVLSGTSGYPSSFLEEVFGGLVRVYGIQPVLSKIKFSCPDDPFVEDEIKRYLKNAK